MHKVQEIFFNGDTILIKYINKEKLLVKQQKKGSPAIFCMEEVLDRTGDSGSGNSPDIDDDDDDDDASKKVKLWSLRCYQNSFFPAV